SPAWPPDDGRRWRSGRRSRCRRRERSAPLAPKLVEVARGIEAGQRPGERLHGISCPHERYLTGLTDLNSKAISGVETGQRQCVHGDRDLMLRAHPRVSALAPLLYLLAHE